MPIEFTNAVARFEGQCRLEEANPLFEWLQRNPGAKIDMTKCEHIHTAIMQLLIVAKPEVLAPPENEFLKNWLLAYIR